MNKTNAQQEWEIEIERAKKRPAMYIGQQETAHLSAVSSSTALARRAKAFEDFSVARVHLAPSQFAVVCEAGVLISSIEKLYDWEGKYVLMQGWSLVTASLREHHRLISLEQGTDSSLPLWQRYFGSPSGPSLDSPTHAAVLAKRFAIAYRTSSGHWCQSFRNGHPESEPLCIQSSSNVGLLVVAELNTDWFTGLPYTKNEIDKLDHLAQIETKWHFQNDLLPENQPASEVFAKWLV